MFIKLNLPPIGRKIKPMKRFYFLYIVCLLAHFVASAQDQTTYFEAFDGHDAGWSEESTVKSSTKIIYGHYEMYHKRSSGGYCYYKDFYPELNGDYTLETKIMQTLGEDNHGFGLLWGGKGANDCYNFMISSNGYFSIGEWSEGKFTSL